MSSLPPIVTDMESSDFFFSTRMICCFCLYASHDESTFMSVQIPLYAYGRAPLYINTCVDGWKTWPSKYCQVMPERCRAHRDTLKCGHPHSGERGINKQRRKKKIMSVTTMQKEIQEQHVRKRSNILNENT